MVRLVKGAYWDTEIKAAQVAGLPDYPVFTRKVATDVSYLACAKMLLAASDVIYPAFATHNANTIGQVKALAARPASSSSSACTAWARSCTRSWPSSSAASAMRATPVRIYAPVGSHKELLAYLVRRLLENGANSSFVNRIADEQVSLDELVRDPVAELEALEPKRNPKIVLPRDLFGAERHNSAGVDLSDPLVREPLLERLKALEARSWTAKPDAREGRGAGRSRRPTTAGSPSARCSKRPPPKSTGWSAPATPRRSTWDALGGEARARLLDRAADLYEEHREEFFSLCIREAGKTLIDARARSARGGRFPALLRVRGAAPVHQAAAAARARPASRTSCACTAAACSPASRRGISRWRSSPAWLRRRWPRAMPSSPSRPGKRR